MDVFDWYELCTYDVHCQQRGMMVSKRKMESIVRDGMGILSSLNYVGMSGEINFHPDYLPECGNFNMKPILSTLTKSAKSTGGRGRVGHVLCDVEFLDGTKNLTTPRTVAELQVAKLSELGFTIKSSSEVEFDIRPTGTRQDFGHSGLWANNNVLEKHLDTFLDLTDEMSDINVNINSFQSELGPGQFEVTMDIAEGIKSPDSTVRFKNASKTFFAKRDLTATFMTKVSLNHLASAQDFNHSLWKDGVNVFIDPSQKHHLSELGQHWLAGIMLHAPGITALCSPTVNCYRRIAHPWAPTYSNWGLDDRMSTIRLKVEGQGRNVYLENRLPSAASNPYLVLACNIAAGMDGLIRKLPLPPSGQTDVPLPTSLEDALVTLENDAVLVSALGEGLVKHFAYCKRQFEIEKLKDFKDDKDLFEKEYEMYFLKA